MSDPNDLLSYDPDDPSIFYWCTSDCDDGPDSRNKCEGCDKKKLKPAPPGKDGVWCRKCGDFVEYAESDDQYGDGMITCWNCKHGFFAQD
jgi:hypothetical protein